MTPARTRWPRTSPEGGEAAILSTVRLLLRGVLVAGLAGLGAELLLLQHYEDASQVIAPALVAAGLLVALWDLASRGPASLLALRLTMGLFLAAGALGVWLHYGASVEFQLEMDPGASGMALFRKAVAAKSPPALAPGAMAQLGLIGLAATYRERRRNAAGRGPADSAGPADSGGDA